LEIDLHGQGKKLEEAARYWAGDAPPQAASVDDGVIEQLETAGAPPEVIEAAKKRMTPEGAHCYVWAENWDCVLFFVGRLRNQWTIAVGMSGAVKVGLDNSKVEATMNMLNIKRKDRPKLLVDLQIMEEAALAVWSEQRS
jgi:hypothetical protein